MAAILLSAGTTVAFWDEQTLSKNSLYQKCTPPDVLDCSSYWKSVVLSGSNESLACAEQRGEGVKILSLSKESGVVLGATCRKDNVNYSSCDFLVGKNRYILAGGQEGGNGVCDLWDMKSQSIVKSYTGYSSPVSCVGSHPYLSQMLSGCTDGAILHHTVSHTKPVKVLRPASSPSEAVNDIVFSPFEQGLVTSCHADGSISFWSIDSQRQLAHFPAAHTGSASHVCFSPYNKMLLASCGTDGKFVFYDILQRKTLSKTKTSCPLFSLCLLNDGTTMVGGGGDGKLHVYDLRNCSSPKDTLPAHTSPVYSLVLSTSASVRRRRSSKNTKNTSTPTLRSRESSVSVPPVTTAEQTPTAANSTSTTIGMDSTNKDPPSIDRVVGGGGDSIFSPLTLGPPSISESRLSDAINDDMSKNRSLPKRFSGSGSDHKLPSKQSKQSDGAVQDSHTPSLQVSTPVLLNTTSPYDRSVGESRFLPKRADFHSTAVHLDSTPSSAMRFEEDIFSPVQSFPSSVEQETQPPSYPSVPGASPGGSVQGKNSPSHPTPPVGPLGGSVLRKNPPSFPRPTAAIAEGVGLPSETEMVQRIHNHVGLDRFTERKMTLGQKDIETEPSAVHDTGKVSSTGLETQVQPLTAPSDSKDPTSNHTPSMPGTHTEDVATPNILVDMIQSKIDDSMEDLRLGFNRELMHLYSDILRQLAMQEKKLENAFSRMELLLAENQQLQNENKQLKDENKRLKTHY